MTKINWGMQICSQLPVYLFIPVRFSAIEKNQVILHTIYTPSVNRLLVDLVTFAKVTKVLLLYPLVSLNKLKFFLDANW